MHMHSDLLTLPAESPSRGWQVVALQSIYPSSYRHRHGMHVASMWVPHSYAVAEVCLDELELHRVFRPL